MSFLLVINLFTASFHQKYYLPRGYDLGDDGRILFGDCDRDGCLELILCPYVGGGFTLYFYELHLPNIWVVDSMPHPNHPLHLWDIGDFDNDGLYDLVFQRGEAKRWWVGISIFESPDSFSYPTQEVWRDTVGQGLVVPICAYDIDKDGLSEIVKVLGDYIHLHIYESIGNNQYEKIAEITTASSHNSSSTLAFGDFDLDGQNEFVFGYSGGEYSIFECNGNNSYQEITLQQLPTANIKDCFSVPDADGDGKLEFVVKGFTVPNAQTQAFIFEATGNNSYQIIKSFYLPNSMGWWYGGGYSDVGDIDGDSVPEICLESASYVYLIKCGGNDSFYVWQTLPGNNNGSSVRVFDIDGNGLSEIIISGGNQTRIYEKTPFVTWFCPEPYDTFYANDTVYPRWRLDETIALDSLRLYWAHPQLGCHLIYQGLPTGTICQWVVPDTQSNMSNRFWLVIKGFGRYDSTYSPVFYIKRAPGIEEFANPHSAFRIPHLEVYPNPFRNALSIKFQIPNSKHQINSKLQIPKQKVASIKIYDISGRLVRQWDYETIRQSDQIVWDGEANSGCQLPPGVYFVCLRNGTLSAIKKVIKLE